MQHWEWKTVVATDGKTLESQWFASHGVGIGRIIWFNLAQLKLARHWQLVRRLHASSPPPDLPSGNDPRAVGRLVPSGVNVERALGARNLCGVMTAVLRHQNWSSLDWYVGPRCGSCDSVLSLECECEE
jgi:hypothetical protein